MSYKRVHIKALILLIVFSLNTVVSFACSLGGIFHSFHHHSDSAAQKSSHGHHHSKKGHHHDHETASHQHESPSSDQPEKDCCSKNVVEVEKVAKSVSRTIQAPAVVFLTSFLTVYASLYTLLASEEKTFLPEFVRWRLPATIQDLRIVIQSFQI